MNFNPAKPRAVALMATALLLLAARAASGQETLRVRNALDGYELTVNLADRRARAAR